MTLRTRSTTLPAGIASPHTPSRTLGQGLSCLLMMAHWLRTIIFILAHLYFTFGQPPDDGATTAADPEQPSSLQPQPDPDGAYPQPYPHTLACQPDEVEVGTFCDLFPRWLEGTAWQQRKGGRHPGRFFHLNCQLRNLPPDAPKRDARNPRLRRVRGCCPEGYYCHAHTSVSKAYDDLTSSRPLASASMPAQNGIEVVSPRKLGKIDCIRKAPTFPRQKPGPKSANPSRPLQRLTRPRDNAERSAETGSSGPSAKRRTANAPAVATSTPRPAPGMPTESNSAYFQWLEEELFDGSDDSASAYQGSWNLN